MSDDPRRGLPSVDRLVRALEQARPDLPGGTLREGARRSLAAARSALETGRPPGDPQAEALALACHLARPRPLRGVAQIDYRWNDLNGDGFVNSRDEVDIAGGSLGAPVNASLSTVNEIDEIYSAPRDLELLAGIEHELAPNLAVGATYTYAPDHQGALPVLHRREWQRLGAL